MLNTLRNAAGSFVAKIFIALLVLSFGVWGIADIFRGFGQDELASVGDTAISPESFRQQFQRQLQDLGRRSGRALTVDEARAFGLDGQVMGSMLSEAALDQDATDKGLGIPDEAVTASIMQDPTFKDTAGNFSRSQFDQVLRSNGYTEQRYAAEQRKVHRRQQIAAAMGTAPTVPLVLLKSANRYRSEGRSIAYVTLTPKALGELAAPSDEQLKEFYDSHKTQFRAPEYRAFEVIEVTPEQLSATIEVSEDDIRSAYEQRKDTFGVPERRAVQQIRFANLDEAKAAREKISGGTDFMDLAKEKNLTEADVSLGTVPKSGIIDPAIADAAFSLGESEVSQPIEGRLGVALVRVTKIEPGTTKTLEEVHDQIKKELALRAAEGKVLDVHDNVEDERAAGSTFEEIANKLSLTRKTFDNVDNAGRGLDGKPAEGLPAAPDFLPTVFRTDPGVEIDPLQLRGSGLAWVNVTAVVPDRERTLEEAHADVEKAWRENEQRRLLGERATELVKKLESGVTIEEVGKEIGSTLTITPALTRLSQSGQLAPAALEAAFATPEGQFGTSQDTNRENRIIFQVRRVVEPTFDPSSKEAKALENSLRQSIANGNLVSYIASKQAEYGVRVNQTALSAILGQ